MAFVLILALSVVDMGISGQDSVGDVTSHGGSFEKHNLGRKKLLLYIY